MRLAPNVAFAVLLLCLAALLAPAQADEFERYKRPDPQRFAQGVAAYDAGRYEDAFEIWLPLARHLDIGAMYNVGLMLRDGRGVPQDLPRAFAFFKRAAEIGHVGAEVNLAEMYYQGRGTRQNYVEAAKWLMLLSRRGHLPSMHKLAGMFERGEGIEPNAKAARTLYIIAYRGGHQPAGNRLFELAEKANEARAVPDTGLPTDAETQIAMLPVSDGIEAPRLRPSSGGELAFKLRGTIGAGGEALETATNPIWALRTTFATMSAIERQIYRIGWTAKNVAGKGPAGASRAFLPRLCGTSLAGFDASHSICRMPPIRD